MIALQLATLAAVAVSTASTAFAHRDAIVNEPPEARLAHFHRSVSQMRKRQSGDSSAAEGAVLNDEQFGQSNDPNFECNYWGYEPANVMQSAFPTSWQVAYLLQNDTKAHAAWDAIKGSIPNISPKGVPSNSLQGSTYDGDADPDCWWTATTCTKPKLKGLPMDIDSCNEPGTWGLTYDDGPECSHNQFYNFLQDHNQTATLFYIGSNVIGYPLQAQRGLTDGHILSAHTWSHNYMTALTSEQAFAELYYTVQAIKWVTGVTVTSWRPPYGDVDDRIRAIANALGLETIIWGHGEDTNDWSIQPGGPAPTASVIANYESLISQASSPALETGGIVVLSHELNPNTEATAMKFLPKMQAAFKHVVPVQVCQNNTMPYHEQTITYPDFADYISGNRLPKGVPAAKLIQASTAPFTIGSVTTTTVAPPSSSAPAPTSSGTASGTASAAAGSVGPTSAPVAARGVSMLTISDFDGYFAQPDLGMAGLASSSTESEDDQEGHEDDEDWSEDPDESDPDLLASDEAGATWWNWQRAQ